MRDAWIETSLGSVLEPITERAGLTGPTLVLSVTEKRGIVPQEEVFRKRIATTDTSKYKVLRPFDIAFNPYLVWAGAVGQWLGSEPGVTSPVYECFRATAGCEPRYVGLVLESGQLAQYFEATAVGSIQRRRRTTVPVFNAAPIVLPPREEQRRIVDLIDAVDQSASAATGLAESARAASSAAIDALTARLLDHPTVELGSISEVVGGLTKDSKKQQVDFVEVPYLRVANVQRGFLDLEEIVTIRAPASKVAKLELLPGDVLFNEGGDRDKLGRGWVWEGQIAHCIHQNHVFRARVVDRAFSPYFVSIWGNSRFGQRWFEEMGSQTTNLASINMRTLRSFPVPHISSSEQQEVVDTYLSFRAVADAASSHCQALHAAREALLADLLTGNHEVPDSYDDLLEQAS